VQCHVDAVHGMHMPTSHAAGHANVACHVAPAPHMPRWRAAQHRHGL
jgi:hypothetical protein